MAEFSKELFEKMELNPYQAEDFVNHNRKKIISIFGGPTRFRRKDYEPTLKYVLYMYDHNTPMRELYPDINQRKEMCYDLASFESENKDVYSLRDEMTRVLAHALMKHQRNMIWSALVSNQQVFWEYQYKMLQPIEVVKGDKDLLQGLKVKGELAKEIDTIMSRIAGYEEQLFGSDTDARDMLSPTSPEEVARLLNNV